jgi:prepilin-type N-terminal cleavage/methylation domain-containing protein
MKKGVSLIEMLVVVAIFAVLGILISRVILTTLRGSNKSNSLVKVRENLDYALAVMERQIRNADSVTTCPNPDHSRIDYRDGRGTATFFSCANIGPAGYVASGSARLTSSEIGITSCSFSCTPAVGRVPPSVTINLIGEDPNSPGVEGAQVTVTTSIFLRTY